MVRFGFVVVCIGVCAACGSSNKNGAADGGAQGTTNCPAGTTILSSTPFSAGTVDADGIFLALGSNDGTAEIDVVRYALDGTAPTTLASKLSSLLGHIATDATNVYVLDSQSPPHLFGIPKAGGAPHEYNPTGDFDGVAITTDGMISDGKNLYFRDTSTSTDCGKLYAYAVDGGSAPRVIAANSCSPPVFADATYVYWGEASQSLRPGGIYAQPIAGGATVKVYDATVDGNHQFDGTFALDDSAVYFTSSNSIKSAPLVPTGGQPNVVIKDEAAIQPVIDGASLYFAHGLGSSTDAFKYQVVVVPKTGGTETPVVCEDYPGQDRIAVVRGTVYLLEQSKSRVRKL